MISNITDSETRKKNKTIKKYSKWGENRYKWKIPSISDQKEKEIRLIINNGKSIHMYLQVFKQALIIHVFRSSDLYNMYNQMKENITISTKS